MRVSPAQRYVVRRTGDPLQPCSARDRHLRRGYLQGGRSWHVRDRTSGARRARRAFARSLVAPGPQDVSSWGRPSPSRRQPSPWVLRLSGRRPPSRRRRHCSPSSTRPCPRPRSLRPSPPAAAACSASTTSPTRCSSPCPPARRRPRGRCVSPTSRCSHVRSPRRPPRQPTSRARRTAPRSTHPRRQTGAGVTVALVDTGVADVADLAGGVPHVNVSGARPATASATARFMAGLVAGDGVVLGRAAHRRRAGREHPRRPGRDRRRHDVADPRARRPAGRRDAAPGRPFAQVVSLALSTGSPLPPQSDPLARALDRLWSRGLTVVVAAGNDGPDAGTVTSPGADPTLITVGSLDEHATSARTDDSVSTFSARGTSSGPASPTSWPRRSR